MGAHDEKAEVSRCRNGSFRTLFKRATGARIIVA